MQVMRLLSFLVVVSLTGCASFTSLQTADIIPQGETNFTVSGNLLYSLPLEESVYEEGNQFVTQLMIRRGLSVKTELQAIISSNSLNGTYKHLLKSGDTFITSYSVGAGYSFLASSFDDQIHVADLPVSMFITYKPKNNFGITLNPKALYRFIGDESTFVVGGSINLVFGENIKFYPEGIMFYDIVIGNIFTGGGFAISF